MIPTPPRFQSPFRVLATVVLFAATQLAFGAAVGPYFATAPTGPAKNLFFFSMKSRAHRTDENIQKRLDEHGFVVTMIDQDDPGAQRLDGYDLIFISSTVDAAGMSAGQAEKYKAAALPLVNCNVNLLGALGLTGSRVRTDWGMNDRPGQFFVYLVNGRHALQGGVANGMGGPFTQPVSKIGFGKPGMAAIVIATIPGESEKAVIFAYPGGGTMDYPVVAPRRRVVFCLEEAQFDLLNETGLQLFDTGVNWAIHRAEKRT